MSTAHATSTPVDSSVYYRGIYWNSYPQVARHLNRRAFDTEEGGWGAFVRRERGGAYERGLSLNCGTAWAERDLLAAGAAEQLVGVDFLDDLLDAARGASVGLPIEYVQMDTNRAEFPPGPFDLVVNHAAGHHIAHVDRVLRRLRELLAPDGTLVTWDYTGPHRNQYTSRMWAAAAAVNERLPEQYRSGMDYPHVPTMLANDPTEAIHSELLLEVMSRYFRHRHLRHLGGPIAYLLLTHNEALYDAPEPLRSELVQQILDADVAHVERHPEDSLFTFAISSPKTDDDLDPAQLTFWTAQEEQREGAAAEAGGRYYPPTAIEVERTMPEPAPPPQPEPLQPYDVALLGPRFVTAALVRCVPIRFPRTLPAFQRLRRIAARARRPR